MSRRDLVHVMNALWDLSGAAHGVGVAVDEMDAAIGRGHRDMRTPLNLASLSDDGYAARLPDGSWALTQEGVYWLREERELADR